MNRRLRRLQREGIHDFQRTRQQPARDDRRNSIARLLQCAVAGQHRVEAVHFQAKVAV